MSTPLTIECEVHFRRESRGRKRLREGAAPPRVATAGRIPRVSKLLALALRFERLLRDGLVKDYAELARLGHVTRARISQIMNLLNLAPDLQELVLFLPRTQSGRDPILLAHLQPIASTAQWRKQRSLFAELIGTSPPDSSGQ
jgi:hypothetical protein